MFILMDISGMFKTKRDFLLVFSSPSLLSVLNLKCLLITGKCILLQLITDIPPTDAFVTGK